MDGYNVCIFAYGQTGTGKTFTMEGTPECRGVNYRAFEELFRIMKERMSLMRYEFSFSMLEVYNEKIRDLLADNSDLCAKKLDIKQSAERTLEVPGLAEIQVCSVEEVWEMHKLCYSIQKSLFWDHQHKQGRANFWNPDLTRLLFKRRKL